MPNGNNLAEAYSHRSILDIAHITENRPIGDNPQTPVDQASFSQLLKQIEWFLKKAHLEYYYNKFSQSKKIYTESTSYLKKYLARMPIEDHPQDEQEWLAKQNYLILPMCIGDTCRQTGDFESAAQSYATGGKYPLVLGPLSLELVWINTAESILSMAEEHYRLGDTDEAKRQFKRILPDTEPDGDNILYQDKLHHLYHRIRHAADQFEQEISMDKMFFDAAYQAKFNAVISFTLSRLWQLENNENYYGYREGEIPSMRYSALFDLASSYAQQASRATRDYIAFKSSAEQFNYSVQTLLRTVAVEKSASDVERLSYLSTGEEVRSAVSAASGAETRRRIARDSYSRYNDIGSDIASLEELMSWAQSAQGNTQVKLGIQSFEHLGLRGGYVRADHRIQEIARLRARKTYGLRSLELFDQIQIRETEVSDANNRVNVAKAHQRVAQARLTASMARMNAAEENYRSMVNREIDGRLYHDLAIESRNTAQLMLERAIQLAYLMENSYEAEQGVTMDRIRLNYGDVGTREGLFAADLLINDIKYFPYHRAISQTKFQSAIKVVSLTKEYPLEFELLKETGETEFTTTLQSFQSQTPGLYNGKIKQVSVEFVGGQSSTGPRGTLRCGSQSTFRAYSPGEPPINRSRNHGTETLLITDYRPKRDGFMLRTPSDQLNIFENIGLETSWHLSLPKHANDFDYADIQDVNVVIGYLCEYDQDLAEFDNENLPPTQQAATVLSLGHDFQDALYLLNNDGEVTFTVKENLLSRPHRDHFIRALALYFDSSDSSLPLTLEIKSDDHVPQQTRFIVPANGKLDLNLLTGEPAFAGSKLTTTWTIQIVDDIERDVNWLAEMLFVCEYEYTIHR